MRSRDPKEAVRTATPLELLFDLCFVVAIAQAATSLHHALSHGQGLEAVLGFITVFLAIWWAWMGFAWFASAFDNDDPLYRLKVFIQMFGVLILAAGVPRAFEHQDFTLITIGYAVLRVGLVSLWLRAAVSDPETRPAALRYAGGTAALQVCWLSLLLLPAERWIFGFCALFLLELLVPVWADRASPTSWHPHHIAERYGLLTIIVIGESVLASTVAIQMALDFEHLPGDLAALIVGAPVILFTMWWLYFSRPGHSLLRSRRATFIWGYGHFFIFASAAATGAGIAVQVDQATGAAHLPDLWADQALTIPVAIYLVSVWILHVRRASASKWEPVAYLATAVLTLASPATGASAVSVAALLTLLTAAVALSGSAPEARPRLSPEVEGGLSAEGP